MDLRNPLIPHCITREFFADMKAFLTPGVGWMGPGMQFKPDGLTDAEWKAIKEPGT